MLTTFYVRAKVRHQGAIGVFTWSDWQQIQAVDEDYAKAREFNYWQLHGYEVNAVVAEDTPPRDTNDYVTRFRSKP